MKKDEILTIGDFEIQVERILSEIVKLKENKSNKWKWIRSKDVQKLLGISASGLQNLRIKKVITPSRFGKTLYYDVEEIQKTLEVNKI